MHMIEILNSKYYKQNNQFYKIVFSKTTKLYFGLFKMFVIISWGIYINIKV